MKKLLVILLLLISSLAFAASTDYWIDGDTSKGFQPGTGHFYQIFAPYGIFGTSTPYGNLTLSSTSNPTKGLVISTDMFVVKSGPEINIISFMDGQSGRPTYAIWNANQATTDIAYVALAAYNYAVTFTNPPDLYFPPGIYYFASYPSGGNTNLQINASKIRLRGDPGKTIFLNSSSNTTGGILWLTGNINWTSTSNNYESASGYVFNAAVEGANSITTTTASNANNFSVGNIIYLKGAYIGVSGEYIGDTNEVTSVNGSTGVIGLKYPLSWDYPGGTATIANVTNQTVTDISIEGIIFQSYASGIVADQVHRLTIRNCQFVPLGSSLPPFQWGQIHNVTVENNEISNLSIYPVMENSRNSSRVIITKNRIYSQSEGILIDEASSYQQIIDNQIFVNDLVGTNSAIIVNFTSNILISRNQITFNSAQAAGGGIPAVWDYVSQVSNIISRKTIISHNTITLNSPGVGIRMENDGTIVENNIIQVTENAIRMEGPHEILSHNLIIIKADGNGSQCVQIQNTSVNQVYNANIIHSGIIDGNVFEGSGSALYWGITVSNDGAQLGGPVITNNQFIGFTYGIQLDSIANEPGAIIANNNVNGASYSGCTYLVQGGQQITRGASAPGSGTWAVGDQCWNTSVTATTTPGWICTTAGAPGTWTAMPNL
jgi:hypothetical protein